MLQELESWKLLLGQSQSIGQEPQRLLMDALCSPGVIRINDDDDAGWRESL